MENKGYDLRKTPKPSQKLLENQDIAKLNFEEDDLLNQSAISSDSNRNTSLESTNINEEMIDNNPVSHYKIPPLNVTDQEENIEPEKRLQPIVTSNPMSIQEQLLAQILTKLELQTNETKILLAQTEKLDQQSQETKLLLDQQSQETKLLFNQQSRETKDQLNSLEKKLESTILKYNEELEKRLDNRINKQEENLNKVTNNVITFQEKINQEIKESHQKIKEDLDEKIHVTKNDLLSELKQVVIHEQFLQNKELSEKTTKNQLEIEENTKTLKEMKEELIKNQSSFGNFPQKIIPEEGRGTPYIFVSCAGTTPSNDGSIPKFNGKNPNPPEFLRRLKNIYTKFKAMPCYREKDEVEILQDILNTSMEHAASNWWQLIKGDITTWEQFEKDFLNKYWNKEIQRSVRMKLETDHYRTGGRLSRSEYFIERVLVMKSLQPMPSEEEIVDRMAEHFEEVVQDARRVQNINTIRGFELLLQREDLKGKTHHMKSSSTPHQRSPNMERRNIKETPHNTPYKNNQTINSSRTPTNYYSYQPYQPRREYQQDYQSKNKFSNNYDSQRHYQQQRRDQYEYKTSQENDHESKPIEKGANKKNFTSPQDNQRKTDTYNYNYSRPGGYNKSYPSKEQKEVCQLVAEQMRTPDNNERTKYRDTYQSSNSVEHLNSNALDQTSEARY